MEKIRFISKTFIKQSAEQSSTLASYHKYLIEADTVIPLHSYVAEPQTQHLVVTFGKDDKGQQVHFNGLTRWYVFRPHVLLFNDQGEVLTGVSKEIQKNSVLEYKGKQIKLISGEDVYLDQPLFEGSCLTWGEVTHGGERLFQTKQHLQNVQNLAKQLQPYRDRVGKPFKITSCYRPEPWNSRAGGARRSQHLTASAIDFYVDGWRNQQLYDHFRNWNGGVGTYSYDNYIIHLDIAGNRRWGVCS